MEIIFVRHAEKENTGEDPYLTENGIHQANHLAEMLKGEPINEFYCSTLNRAKQTSEILSKAIGVKPIVEDSLKEFESEILRKNRKSWNAQEKSHYTSLIRFLKKISLGKNENKTILIVAHGVTNRIILTYFLKLNIRKIIAFRQSEAGANCVYWADKFKNWRLKYWNNNSHVPPELHTKTGY